MPRCCAIPVYSDPGVSFEDPDTDSLLSFYDAYHTIPLCGWVPEGEEAGFIDDFTGPYGRHEHLGVHYKSWTDLGGYATPINPDSLWRVSRFEWGSAFIEKTLSCDGTSCSSSESSNFTGPPPGDLTSVSFGGSEILPVWRMLHDPTATGYLKAWLIHESYDYLTDTFTRSLLDPYEWNASGTGNGTALVDIAKPVGIGAPLYPAWNSGTTYAAGRRVSHSESQYESVINGNLNDEPPSANWTEICDAYPHAPVNLISSAPIVFTRRSLKSNHIRIWKYSLVEGYEPAPTDPDADPDDLSLGMGDFFNGFPQFA